MSEPADIAVPPPRKRRRPALSCEQCRRRKIKCDRSYPCRQCVQSKTTNCTYQADHQPPSSDNPVTPEIPIVARSIEQRIGGPNHIPSLCSSNHTIYAAKHSVTPTLDELLNPARSPHPNVEGQQATTSQQSLMDRIQTLEKKLKQSSRLIDVLMDVTQKIKIGHLEISITKARWSRKSYVSVHPPDIRLVKRADRDPDGTVSKTRFFGSSHWMHAYGMFDKIAMLSMDPVAAGADVDNAKAKELTDGVEKCKALARKVKSGPHRRWLANPNFRETFPPRNISDQLIGLYFQTFESTIRVLHRPTFFQEYEEYWNDPIGTSTVNVLKILLVMSLGACFYQGPDSNRWRFQALQWIFSAQSWLASPFEKGRLHISGIQVYCLVLVARVDNAVAGDLIWISAGALLRTAFQMGFHRDPKYLPNIKPFHAELRRRLWATILEINVQSALDSGQPPLISMDDFDTEPPSNVNDSDLSDETRMIEARSDDVFTETSTQRILQKSLGIRLEIVRQLNNFHCETSYDEVLQLGSRLTAHCKEIVSFVAKVNSITPAHPSISQLRHNLLDLWVRRFLLALHRPYAIKAQENPNYYYSRKVCLDCAMTMLSYPSHNPSTPSAMHQPGIMDDYTRLKVVSGGFSKGLTIHASMVVFAELLTQVEEDSSFSEQSRAAREPLKQALRNCKELCAQRVALMENNIKSHLFLSVVIAHIDAMERSENPHRSVLEAGLESVRLCYDLLSQRIAEDSKVDEAATTTLGVGNLFTPATIGTTPDLTWDLSTQDLMQDWAGELSVPDSWLLSGWDNNSTWM